MSESINKTSTNTSNVPKKRGRKAKQPLEVNQMQEEKQTLEEKPVSENIVIHISESETHTEDINNVYVGNNSGNLVEVDCDEENMNILVSGEKDKEKPLPKKRGRKPKGGKIIHQITPLNSNKEPKPNVILHLKCSLKDLFSGNLMGTNIEGFSFSNPNLNFNLINNNMQSSEMSGNKNNITANINTNTNNCVNSLQFKMAELDNDIDSTDYDNETNSNKDNDIREVWKKLKVLEHNLHINSTDNKKSACFWDTCEFDNPPIYIPKFFMNDTYHVYGCFCSPECAVAHLMEESIDSSIKFERYQLLNHIYSKIYNYNKNIKPAPNPYYMLEKYYGNLSTQEYRSLLRNERLFLVVDKPLTRVMPELHEDNDDFIINNKIIPSNAYQVKKRLQKKQTKTNILNERFGLVQS